MAPGLLFLRLPFLVLPLLLVGCGFGTPSQLTSASPAPGISIQGTVHGGQQPVAGATLQLLAASASGYSAAATALLVSPVTTSTTGAFSISGLYVCPSANSQVYLVATGGNPGLTAGTNNPQLSLMAALGSCGNLSSSTHVIVNEATTVAAVWALSPFMSDALHVGTSSTNVAGLTNAFASAAQLVSTDGGVSPGTNLPTGTAIPVPQLNTLANILAACVNTAGGSSGDGTACGKLMLYATPTGGTTPTDTVGAALSMARNAASNVSALYALQTSASPFQPALASAPYDFTLSIGYTGPTHPQQLAIDPSSNVFVLDYPGQGGTNGSFTAKLWGFTNQGATLQSTLNLTDAAYMDFNPDGTLWLNFSGGEEFAPVSGENLNALCMERITTAGTVVDSVPCFTGTGLNYASYYPLVPVVASANASLWLYGDSLGLYTGTGTPVSGSTGLSGSGYAYGHLIAGMAVDGSNNGWVVSNYGGVSTLSEFSASGVASDGTSGITLTSMGGNASVDAVDRSGNIYVVSNPAGAGHNLLSSFSSTGTPITTAVSLASGNLVGKLLIDGDNTLWLQGTGAATEGITRSTLTGTNLETPGSTSTITYSGGYLLSYAAPTATSETYVYANGTVAIDNAGNIWNTGLVSGTTSTFYVFKMVGVAAPVVTPLTLAASTGKLGQRP